MNVSIEQILEAMDLYGGGFVKQLAKLYRKGDMSNQKKLRKCFAEYFKQYEAIAELKARAISGLPEVTPMIVHPLTHGGESESLHS